MEQTKKKAYAAYLTWKKLYGDDGRNYHEPTWVAIIEAANSSEWESHYA